MVAVCLIGIITTIFRYCKYLRKEEVRQQRQSAQMVAHVDDLTKGHKVGIYLPIQKIWRKGIIYSYHEPTNSVQVQYRIHKIKLTLAGKVSGQEKPTTLEELNSSNKSITGSEKSSTWDWSMDKARLKEKYIFEWLPRDSNRLKIRNNDTDEPDLWTDLPVLVGSQSNENQPDFNDYASSTRYEKIEFTTELKKENEKNPHNDKFVKVYTPGVPSDIENV
eukprot:UN28060